MLSRQKGSHMAGKDYLSNAKLKKKNSNNKISTCYDEKKDTIENLEVKQTSNYKKERNTTNSSHNEMNRSKKNTLKQYYHNISMGRNENTKDKGEYRKKIYQNDSSNQDHSSHIGRSNNIDQKQKTYSNHQYSRNKNQINGNNQWSYTNNGDIIHNKNNKLNSDFSGKSLLCGTTVDEQHNRNENENMSKPSIKESSINKYTLGHIYPSKNKVYNNKSQHKFVKFSDVFGVLEWMHQRQLVAIKWISENSNNKFYAEDYLKETCETKNNQNHLQNSNNVIDGANNQIYMNKEINETTDERSSSKISLENLNLSTINSPRNFTEFETSEKALSNSTSSHFTDPDQNTTNSQTKTMNSFIYSSYNTKMSNDQHRQGKGYKIYKYFHSKKHSLDEENNRTVTRR
ncbi:hypothetical protein cand_003340 [Cryptosporidium andersoni]|uniref:Uncharacterized protein n=1 Tax=Cryptosporidium andersoni TaxID=117008 RepID=A0A1J4MKX4_9CRYT|nr:hypothetical protein cand_003340 [Cryptosporidium andersoni]